SRGSSTVEKGDNMSVDAAGSALDGDRPADRAADERILLDVVRSVVGSGGPPDWRVRTSDGRPWCYVEPAAYRPPPQGWKLHVSATPLSAPMVLARCVQVMMRHGCA